MSGNILSKKGLVVAIILLFMGMSVIPSTGNVVEKKFSMLTNGDTLYVGGSGPGNYSKIQDAIDDAIDGDTVFVYDDSSPYYENVVVDKSINLIGEDRNNTIIDGGGVGDVAFISSESVNINGFMIQNSGSIWYDAGIDINSDYNAISGNNIINNGASGIIMRNSDENLISGNCFMNNQDGIFLHTSSNTNTISGNNITNNRNDGIAFLFDSHYNMIYENTISNNVDDGIDFHVEVSSNNNTIYHNNLINNTVNAHDSCYNTWNDSYPSGGNYWDDYWGDDEDGDGIGDTPYPILGDVNQDSYPLMNPWGENLPVANFTYSADNLSVTFDASSSYDRDGEIVTWLWDFGDGVEGAGIIVEHTYQEDGEYPVTLTVIDNDGYTDNLTKQIEVENGGYDFKTILIIGRIANLNAEGDFITFEAVNILCITFFPFSLNPYTSGEEITILYDYLGVVGTRFIFALCGASI